MFLDQDQITNLRLTTASDPEVHETVGVAHYKDPAQAVRRMAQCGGIPYLRIGGRLRFHVPTLRAWAAERLSASADSQAVSAAA